MSYILEALKMSEQSRQQRTASAQYSLLPMVDTGTETWGHRHRYWVVAALALNGLALAILLRPVAIETVQTGMTSQKVLTDVVSPASVSDSMSTVASAMTPVPAIPAAAISPEVPIRASGTARPSASPPPEQALGTVSNNQARTARLPANRTHTTIQSSPTTSEPAQTEPTPSAGIPASIQKQLPPITVAGIIHDGANNLVIVNDKLLHEGDEVSPGLKLEKIRDSSVELSFKGYRFER